MKVLKFIDEQFEKWFLIVSLIVMVLVTFIQIVLRWFNAATVWAEEFSRYVMLYQVWVGASYAVHEDAHIRITALIGKLSGGRRRGMDLVVLTLWLTVEGCVLVGKIAAMGQVSSAMRIPMTIPYASVPIGGALMTIRLVQKIVERLRNTQEEEA
mgnify:CR=1 FL=1